MVPHGSDMWFHAFQNVGVSIGKGTTWHISSLMLIPRKWTSGFGIPSNF